MSLLRYGHTSKRGREHILVALPQVSWFGELKPWNVNQRKGSPEIVFLCLPLSFVMLPEPDLVCTLSKDLVVKPGYLDDCAPARGGPRSMLKCLFHLENRLWNVNMNMHKCLRRSVTHGPEIHRLRLTTRLSSSGKDL
ncbi:hypothetical protein ACN47E_003634 [Coniothyrium glycines]